MQIDPFTDGFKVVVHLCQWLPKIILRHEETSYRYESAHWWKKRVRGNPLIQCPKSPFSSCLDQAWRISFLNILLKKRKFIDQRKTFISVKFWSKSISLFHCRQGWPYKLRILYHLTYIINRFIFYCILSSFSFLVF